MAISVQEIMRRKLPVLLSLVILVAVAEGVVLCKSKQRSPAKSSNNVREDHSSFMKSDDILHDEPPTQRANADYKTNEYRRKESWEDKILRAMLRADSDANYDNSYRAENPKFRSHDASLTQFRKSAAGDVREWAKRDGDNPKKRFDYKEYVDEDNYYDY